MNYRLRRMYGSLPLFAFVASIAGCGTSVEIDGGYDAGSDAIADAAADSIVARDAMADSIVARDTATDVPTARDAMTDVPTARDATTDSSSPSDATTDVPTARDATTDVPTARDAAIDSTVAPDVPMDVPVVRDTAVDVASDARTDSRADTMSSDTGTPVVCPMTTIAAEPTEQLYVATNGNDSATGTITAPLATLSAAARRFPSGGTIIVRGGTYGPQRVAATGLAGHPLFIRAATGEVPVFDGSTVTGTYGTVIALSAASHVVLKGLEVANCHASQCSAIQGGPVSDLAIVGCHLHDLDGTAARFAGQSIVFDGNHIHDVALVNVNNTAYPNGGWPTCMGTLPNSTTPTTPQANGVVIRNNLIENCWGEGIGVWYATNAVIDGNVVINPFSVGIYMDNSSNVTVTRNFVHVSRGIHGSSGSGIQLSTEHYSSMTLYASTDIAVSDNVVVGGQGINWWRSPETTAVNTYQRVSVTNNTAIATTNGALSFQTVQSGAPVPSGCTASNNVFIEATNASLGNPSGWTLTSNAWVNSPRPGIAGATDVTLSATLGTVTMATDVEPLAAVVGSGVSGTGVVIDYACNPRDATSPRRGAYER